MTKSETIKMLSTKLSEATIECLGDHLLNLFLKLLQTSVSVKSGFRILSHLAKQKQPPAIPT